MQGSFPTLGQEVFGDCSVHSGDAAAPGHSTVRAPETWCAWLRTRQRVPWLRALAVVSCRLLPPSSSQTLP